MTGSLRSLVAMAGRLKKRLGQMTARGSIVGDHAPSEPPDPSKPSKIQRTFTRELKPRSVEPSGPATEALFSRLGPADIERLIENLTDEHREMWELASDADRKRLALALSVHYRLPHVLEPTRLSAEMPPPEIHSMVHGMLAEAGGSYYLADLVLGCFDATAPLEAGSHVLDFSCSSGRVVRVLATVREDVHWHGCDPNAGAIGWASEHLPTIDFFVADTSPPLPMEAGAFQAAFAISVWSHYSEAAALRWFEEMRRIIAPGGSFIFTTHGLQSCAWFAQVPDTAIDGKLGKRWIADTATRLQENGHCFWPVFGEQGDWGVVAADWGLAFFTPEWLLENLTPAWAIRRYAIGRAYGNQDLYVLERQ